MLEIQVLRKSRNRPGLNQLFPHRMVCVTQPGSVYRLDCGINSGRHILPFPPTKQRVVKRTTQTLRNHVSSQMKEVKACTSRRTNVQLSSTSNRSDPRSRRK